MEKRTILKKPYHMNLAICICKGNEDKAKEIIMEFEGVEKW